MTYAGRMQRLYQIICISERQLSLPLKLAYTLRVENLEPLYFGNSMF
jgi:hypothetical protein